MISAIFGAWFTSTPLLWAIIALLVFGGYEGWKFHERAIGKEKLTAAIQQKADKNADLAKEVRDAVDSGARGVRGKYQRSGD